MVDQGGRNEHCTTCPDCKGNGSAPWKDVHDWQHRMGEEIDFQVKDMSRSYSIIGAEFGFLHMLDVARDVRSAGCECVKCAGRGQV